MPTRFNDFNSLGEPRLSYGKECLSDKPIALTFPQNERIPLILRQQMELKRMQEILKNEDIEEDDNDLLDFEIDGDDDFTDASTVFENAAEQLEMVQAVNKQQHQQKQQLASQQPVAPVQKPEDTAGSED